MNTVVVNVPSIATPVTHNSILVVEDEFFILEVLVLDLTEAGFRVIAATNADEALAALDEDPNIDLLLTDIRLPGQLEGWDIAERARAVRDDLPIIYATGYSADHSRRVAGSLIIHKPYLIASVISAAKSLGVVPSP